MFTRVLICYDGSVASRKAAYRGFELAKMCAARIYLLDVYSRIVPQEVLWAGVAGSTFFVDPRLESEDWLRQICRTMETQGLQTELIRAKSDVIEEIAQCTRRLAIDLVVIGYCPNPATPKWLPRRACQAVTDRVSCCVLIDR